MERGSLGAVALGTDRFTVEGILGWLDGHYERTGKWPVALSGPVMDAPGETWINVEFQTPGI